MSLLIIHGETFIPIVLLIYFHMKSVTTLSDKLFNMQNNVVVKWSDLLKWIILKTL